MHRVCKYKVIDKGRVNQSVGDLTRIVLLAQGLQRIYRVVNDTGMARVYDTISDKHIATVEKTEENGLTLLKVTEHIESPFSLIDAFETHGSIFKEHRGDQT